MRQLRLGAQSALASTCTALCRCERQLHDRQCRSVAQSVVDVMRTSLPAAGAERNCAIAKVAPRPGAQ